MASSVQDALDNMSDEEYAAYKAAKLSNASPVAARASVSSPAPSSQPNVTSDKAPEQPPIPQSEAPVSSKGGPGLSFAGDSATSRVLRWTSHGMKAVEHALSPDSGESESAPKMGQPGFSTRVAGNLARGVGRIGYGMADFIPSVAARSAAALNAPVEAFGGGQRDPDMLDMAALIPGAVPAAAHMVVDPIARMAANYTPLPGRGFASNAAEQFAQDPTGIIEQGYFPLKGLEHGLTRVTPEGVREVRGASIPQAIGSIGQKVIGGARRAAGVLERGAQMIPGSLPSPIDGLRREFPTFSEWGGRAADALRSAPIQTMPDGGVGAPPAQRSAIPVPFSRGVAPDQMPERMMTQEDMSQFVRQPPEPGNPVPYAGNPPQAPAPPEQYDDQPATMAQQPIGQMRKLPVSQAPTVEAPPPPEARIAELEAKVKDLEAQRPQASSPTNQAGQPRDTPVAPVERPVNAPPDQAAGLRKMVAQRKLATPQQQEPLFGGNTEPGGWSQPDRGNVVDASEASGSPKRKLPFQQPPAKTGGPRMNASQTSPAQAKTAAGDLYHQGVEYHLKAMNGELPQDFVQKNKDPSFQAGWQDSQDGVAQPRKSPPPAKRP